MTFEPQESNFEGRFARHDSQFASSFIGYDHSYQGYVHCYTPSNKSAGVQCMTNDSRRRTKAIEYTTVNNLLHSFNSSRRMFFAAPALELRKHFRFYHTPFIPYLRSRYTHGYISANDDLYICSPLSPLVPEDINLRATPNLC